MHNLGMYTFMIEHLRKIRITALPAVWTSKVFRW